jgi:hypothetical protein
MSEAVDENVHQVGLSRDFVASLPNCSNECQLPCNAHWIGTAQEMCSIFVFHMTGGTSVVIGCLVLCNRFAHWQLIVDKFDQEGTMDEVFAERLAMGFPVDHIHGSRRLCISLHNIFPYRRSQGFWLDSLPVSRCNCLALAV